MSYQCPTCGNWRSCWSPEIFGSPASVVTELPKASWNDGFPELVSTDDSPVRDPTNQKAWLPPLHSSYRVLVELGADGVSIDRACAMGDSETFWEIYGKRVTGWMPLPKIRAAIAGAAGEKDRG